MKSALIFFISFILAMQAKATIPKSIINRFHLIVELVKNNNSKELAKYIEYPLQRPYPLKTLRNQNDFIAYYDTLIDNSFKNKIRKFKDNDILEHNFSYGLVGEKFSGEIWLNEDGKITVINYQSDNDKALQAFLINKIKKEMHPSVADWDENVVIGKSEKLLIRIDKTSKGLRYTCWSKGKPDSAQPDLILFDGEEEKQGTMGGWSWTFTSGDWHYVINDVEVCDKPVNCGLFLELYLKDDLKSNIRLNQIN